MKKTHGLSLVLLLLFGCHSSTGTRDKVSLDVNAELPAMLSACGFFAGNINQLKPNPGVTEYSLINTMFNDGASKKSFYYLPTGSQLQTDSAGNFVFPEGSCLINCTYYLNDERQAEGTKTLVETQLLLKQKNNWTARNYIWNKEQTDADLNIVGDNKTISWLDKNGNSHQVDFMIAGKNQCKSCHNANGEIIPIGFTAAELNHHGQLQQWSQSGLLSLNSTVVSTAPHVSWQDTSATLDNRVRAYLNINCAHCHSEKGPGKVSGLFLTYYNHNMEAYGVCKSPPSAGKGSCNLKYDIVPGQPGESIIVCRMAATDLDTKMPELGRTTTDNDGVNLIINWILELKGDCAANK